MSHEQQLQAAIRAKCFHPTGQWEQFTPEDDDQSIISRFEQMVARYPDRLAIKHGDQSFTYADLNDAANQVANEIILRDTLKSAPIVLLFHQTPYAIMAMFGVLKANRCYVPLDPAHPDERLSQKIADAQPSLILTLQRFRDQLPLNNVPNVNIVWVDLMLKKGEIVLPLRQRVANPLLNISPYAPAMILYTSGSTGQAKRIVISHRAILHGCRRRTHDLHLSPEDRCACVHAYDAMAGIRDHYFPLLSGAAILLFDIKKVGSKAFESWVKAEQITMLGLVPPLFRQFLQNLDHPTRFPQLRIIAIGGDRLHVQDIQLYQQCFTKQVILHNTFGATETVGAICSYLYNHDYHIEWHAPYVPAGYPMSDIQIIIASEQGEMLPRGEIGEIVVFSKFLADKVQSNVCPPLPNEPNAQLFNCYKTGDIGIQLTDGCLLYLGRKDHQVKIRGARVELAEIEYVLWQTQWFKEIIVVARPGQNGEQRLVAYAVSAQPLAPSISQMRRAVSAKLPSVMVPSAFVLLDVLPLNINGKVDVKALPDPSTTRPIQDTAYVAARNAVEATIVEIWQAVLGIAPIGIDDHFLDLGGDSLQATQIVGRIAKQCHIAMPPHVLMSQPTIDKMALAIIQHQAKLVDSQMLESLLVEVEKS